MVAVFVTAIDNLTALREVHAPAWIPKALCRGTWDVLDSCPITLGFCVYTAIHLNIPLLEESKFSFYLRILRSSCEAARNWPLGKDLPLWRFSENAP
jgi:hypothetical protein